MAEPFDPYRKWLGIPPSQQPPHHYRLLGIELYEEDAEVIDTAASQRMSYLQDLGGGPHVKESQRLLNEVSAARRCLLDKQRKAEYDAGLKAKIAKDSSPKAPPKPPPIQKASRVEDDEDTVTVKITDLGITTDSKRRPTTAQSSDAGKPAAAGAAEPRPTVKKRRRVVPLLVVGVVVLGAATVAVFFALNRPAADVAANPIPDAEYAYSDEDLKTQRAIRPREKPTPRPAAAMPSALPAATAPRKSSTTQSATPSPAASPTATSPFSFSTAKSPEPSPGDAVKTAPRPSATKTPEPPASPADFSMFMPAGAVTSPDVRPHFISSGPAIQNLRGGFRDGDEYHLFFGSSVVSGRQLTPVWGHLVSRDLFTWTKSPAMTPPVDVKTQPEIGTAFCDRNNASGLGKDGAAPWLVPFTYVYVSPGGNAKLSVGLAVSTDRGAKWTAAEPNLNIPDLGATVVGPQLFRHQASEKWCLLYCMTPAPAGKTTSDVVSTYRLLSSPDLKQWEKLQDVPFRAAPLPVELIELSDPNDARRSKWLFLHAGGQFRIVDFDGAKVTAGPGVFSLQAGPGLTGFCALEETDGKSAIVTAAFDSGDALAFPRRLQLSGDGVVPSSLALPTTWLTGGKTDRLSGHVLAPDAPLLPTVAGSAFQFQLQAAAQGEAVLQTTIFGTPVQVDFKNKQLRIGKREPVALPTSDLQLSATVDLHLVEMTIGGLGLIAFRNGAGPDQKTPLELKSLGGPVQISSLTISSLNPPKPAAPAKPGKE